MHVPKIIEWALESSLNTENLNFQEFSRSDVIDLTVKGGFPEIRNLSERSRGKRYLAQVNHVIDRDIPSIANIRKPDSFRRLVNQIAVRTANELNISSLSRDLNMS